MCLSEQVKISLDYIQSIDVSDIEDTLEAGRIFYEEFIPVAGEAEAIYKIENLEIPSFGQTINIPIYRPSNEKELPAVIYFYGGWFNAGGLVSSTLIIGAEYDSLKDEAIGKTAEFLIQNFNQ